jgi:hypothetical protein
MEIADALGRDIEDVRETAADLAMASRWPRVCGRPQVDARRLLRFAQFNRFPVGCADYRRNGLVDLSVEPRSSGFASISSGLKPAE